MDDTTLCLLPQPQQLRRLPGTFRLNAQTEIVLLPEAGEIELAAARSLQREIEADTGLALPVVKTARPARTDNLILLAVGLEAAWAYLGDLSYPASPDEHGEQAYILSISPERVVAVGAGARGAYYAAQTLRQIARGEHAVWPALQMMDWPALPYRGLMLDVSRGKVFTVETLKHVVDVLSLFKANVLQLYTEHTFAFPHHPRIGEGCSPLSGDDMLELDAYARERQVELMPNLNSFGHCAHLLALPEYAHLAESAAGWSLCPLDEGTYALLDELYADLLPAFRSRLFNVGCDETFDLGKGRSKAAVAAEGTGRVYLRHLLRLHELAARYGCRIQIWGDILLHYPELVPELPEDVVLLDWHYEASDDYPSVRVFAASGREFWVCPGTSSWNTLFPRIENSNGNIKRLAFVGAEQGARGLLNTDWGDGGHYQPIGQCWYGYAYGAEQSWSGGRTPDERFDRCFGRLFFGRDGETAAAALRALGRLNALPGMAVPNASHTIHALLDEPLVGPITAQIPAESAQEILRVCGEVETSLRQMLPAADERASLEEILFTAQLMAAMARKVLVCQQARATIAQPPAAAQQAVANLRASAEALLALNSELVGLVAVFRAQWLRRARQAEMDITLGYYANLAERLAAARAWLLARASELEAGQTPNYDLAAYAQDAQSYEILGQGFWRRLQEIGITWD